MVLIGTKLSRKKLNILKTYLSDFCDDVSFRSCLSLKCVVELLKLESKMSIFNIEPLVATCCKSCSQPLFKTKACRAVQEYGTQLVEFMSGISLKNFRCSLREQIKDVKGIAEVTLKLNDTVGCYTAADIIKKLPYQLFRVTSKALVLCEVRPGCVCVTWCVPTSLVPTLREKAEQLSPQYLASKGVLELVIGLRIAPNEGLCVMIYSYYSDLSLYIAAALNGHTASSLAQVDAASRDVDIATGKAGEYMHTWMVCI